jgi:hypothetical protein
VLLHQRPRKVGALRVFSNLNFGWRAGEQRRELGCRRTAARRRVQATLRLDQAGQARACRGRGGGGSASGCGRTRMPPAEAEAQHRLCSDPAVACPSPRDSSTTMESATTSAQAVEAEPSSSAASAAPGVAARPASAAQDAAPAGRATGRGGEKTGEMEK